MSDVVIRAEGLGKQYRLGARQQVYPTLRDQLTGLLKSPFRRPELAETIWALKDVSFEVKQGEVVGIIGRNGAGKSTLLKILSRITEPTEGQVALRGRVGSLLEVGTGFHPELTGRENVFLNGAVLGMRRREIQRKFDEIVAFADVEKFIDTPVKHYSSGMYMRLAFAVAAHLEPEILIVDEVLAVGDAEFQKKCLGKMGDVAKEGRTVLFVSHNMWSLRQLCDDGLLLGLGKITARGSMNNVIDRYMQEEIKIGDIYDVNAMMESLPAYHGFKLCRLEIIQGGEIAPPYLRNDLPIEILIHYRLLEKIDDLDLGIFIVSPEGQLIFRSMSGERGPNSVRDKGSYISRTLIPAHILAGPRKYRLRVNARLGYGSPGWLLSNLIEAKLAIMLQIKNVTRAERNNLDFIAPLLSWETQTTTDLQ